MKRNKTFITMAILIAVVALGIGYASMSGILLKINGNASATTADSNFNVDFKGEPAVEKKDASNNALTGEEYVATATIAEAVEGHKLAASFNMSGFNTKGQKAIFTYTIENSSPELGANLAIPNEEAKKITNSNDTYFDVTAVLANDSIAAGESTTVTVTVALKKTPTSSQTATIYVPIDATPVEA